MKSRSQSKLAKFVFIVMAGLVPAIHVSSGKQDPWMPGTRPGMTNLGFP
ncbi:MAG TPA: hypothetical protein VL993_17940 [Stellaceae bacterium]|nr:hypothetical protein [Stellaceae bacterium]